jgi:dihydroorotate dehydrogenase electron transfer subunit
MSEVSMSTTCQKAFEFVATSIDQHRLIARDTWQMTVQAPELAAQAKPGQFFMVRIAGQNDPLIGRALAMYDMHRDANGVPNSVSVVYTVKGKFTQALSRCTPGSKIEMWGPLGNGFSNASVDHLILVAGGVGQTPMLTLASAALGLEAYGTFGNKQNAAPKFASRVTLCYGARSQGYLAGLSDFQRVCTDVRIATDDGSLGHHGRVTEILEQTLGARNSSCRIACCGPEAMMEAVSEVARTHDVACEVSLETPMACGIGICFTCVAKVRQPHGEWDYRRTCIEGPIFDSEKIEW